MSSLLLLLINILILLQPVPNAVPTVKITLENARKTDLKTISKTVRIIPLKKSLTAQVIGNPSKIVKHNNRLFLLDKSTKTILVYTMQGDYLFSINKHGQGPGEFMAINNFFIADNNLTLIDHQLLKLLSFSTDTGKFIREKKFPTTDFSNFIKHDAHYLVLNPPLDNKKESDKFLLTVMNDKFKTQSRYLPYKGGSNILFSSGEAFQLVAGEISILPTYSQTIYGFKEGKIYPKLTLDFGNHNMDRNELLSNPKYTSDPLSFPKRLKELPSIYFLNNIESEQYHWFFYSYKGDRYSSLFKKKDGLVYSIKNCLPSELNFAELPIGVIDDRYAFIAIEEPVNVQDLYKKGLLKENPSFYKPQNYAATLVLVSPDLYF